MRRAAVLGVLLVCAYATTPLVAQDGGEAEDTFPTFHPLGDVYPLAAQVPFGLGEHLEYQVKLGIFEVGTGFLTVHGVDLGIEFRWGVRRPFLFFEFDVVEATGKEEGGEEHRSR